MIVVDSMKVSLRGVSDHNNRHARVVLSRERIVINPVVLPIKPDPVIPSVLAIRVVVDNSTVGETGVGCMTRIIALSKLDDTVIYVEGTAFEIQSVNDQRIATNEQFRSAVEGDLSRRFGSKCNR